MNIQKQARRMLKRNKRMIEPLAVGAVVKVLVDKVDRGRLDPTSWLGVIVERKEGRGTSEGMVWHRVAGRHAVLEVMYLQGDLYPLPNTPPDTVGLADVLDTYTTLPVVTIRRMARLESEFGGQGLMRCMCSGQCATRKCRCYAAGVVCGPLCHKVPGDCGLCQNTAERETERVGESPPLLPKARGPSGQQQQRKRSPGRPKGVAGRVKVEGLGPISEPDWSRAKSKANPKPKAQPKPKPSLKTTQHPKPKSSPRRRASSQKAKANVAQPRRPSSSSSSSETPSMPSDFSSSEDNDVYPALKVVAIRGSPGSREYRVRWVGYDSGADTWEPEAHVGQGLIEDFEPDSSDDSSASGSSPYVPGLSSPESV